MLTCDFCGKECRNRIQKSAHQRFCKQNPNYDTHLQKHLETSQRAATLKSAQKKKQRAAQDPLNQIQTYTFKCQKCGKQYTLDLKVRDYNKGKYSKFCSRFCANSRPKSEQSKAKARESLNKTRSQIRTHICPKCGKEFQAPGTSSKKYCEECKLKTKTENKIKHKNIKKKNKKIKQCINKKHKSRYHDIGLHATNCQECGRQIYVRDANATHCFTCCQKLGIKHFQQYQQDGIHKKMYPQTKEKKSQLSKQLMRQGKIKPWQSRNITSYPQRFFIKVLNFNNISYQREKHVGKYFLDFVIQTPKGKIDLQIDGKQHWMISQQIQSDKLKDKYITNQGYIVYRIQWNQINTQKGKDLMRNKINKFLQFYKNIM